MHRRLLGCGFGSRRRGGGGLKKNIKIAVMGCVVNGPGESMEADIGIAGGKGEGLVYKKGKPIGKVPESKMLEFLMSEIEKM